MGMCCRAGQTQKQKQGELKEVNKKAVKGRRGNAGFRLSFLSYLFLFFPLYPNFLYGEQILHPKLIWRYLTLPIPQKGGRAPSITVPLVILSDIPHSLTLTFSDVFHVFHIFLFPFSLPFTLILSSALLHGPLSKSQSLCHPIHLSIPNFWGIILCESFFFLYYYDVFTCFCHHGVSFMSYPIKGLLPCFLSYSTLYHTFLFFHVGNYFF